MSKTLPLIFLVMMSACGTSSNKEPLTISTDSLNSLAYEIIWLHQNYDSAKNIYELVLDKEPANKDANFGIVNVELLSDNYEIALDLTDSLFKVFPNRYWFNLYKGQAVERQFSIDSAKQYYLKFMADAGDTTWYFNPALIAITEERPLTQEEIDEFAIDDISYRNELLNYTGGGWYEIYRNQSDTSLFFKTDLPHSDVFDYLMNNGMNAISVVGADQGVNVYFKKKFLTNALELGFNGAE